MFLIMQIIQYIDEKTLFFFQSIRLDILTSFFSIFIKLEFWHVLAAILVLYFFMRTKVFRAPVISYFLAWNGSIACYTFLKDYFHRPRPVQMIKGLLPAIPTPHSYSFPSGHATMAAAIAVVLVYHFPKARYWVVSLSLLAGISRIYFGVHYPSDVVAGFILGGIVGVISLYGEKIILRINKSH
jgi:undecaprenyl-diphosphatase